MAVESLASLTCDVVLEDGTDSKGNLKTTTTNIGTLDKDGWNGDKALAIIGALEPCLNKTLYNIQVAKKFHLSAQ